MKPEKVTDLLEAARMEERARVLRIIVRHNQQKGYAIRETLKAIVDDIVKEVDK